MITVQNWNYTLQCIANVVGKLEVITRRVLDCTADIVDCVCNSTEICSINTPRNLDLLVQLFIMKKRCSTRNDVCF